MAKPFSKPGSDPIEHLIGRAMEHHRANRLADAEVIYLQILGRRPRHFDAQHLLGVLRAQQGRLNEALELLRSALKTKSRSDVALSDCGLILHKLGRFDEALACFDQALAIRPDHPAALSNRGNVLSALGRYDDALLCYERALALRPDYPEALSNRAAAHAALGRLGEALASYDRALAIRPHDPDSWRGRGAALGGLGRSEEAIASFDRAIALRARDPQAHFQRGTVLASLGRYAEALASFDHAIAIDGGMVAAFDQRGNVLLQLRRAEDAIRSYDAALAIAPRCVGALNNRGAAFKEIKRYEEALADFDAVLAIEPASVDALYNRANLLKELRSCNEALAAYRHAISVAPHHADAFGIVEAAAGACAWGEVAEFLDGLIGEIRAGKPTIPPFPLLALSDDPQLHLQCARSYLSAWLSRGATPLPAREARAAVPRDRIRLAYLSADFHEHATSYLIAEMVERHDRSRFEVLGFSFGRDDGSPMRRRVSSAFDRFHDVRGMSDQEVALLLRDSSVDIAVDLKGYTQDCRPQILAFRPAPVQVSYLGYPGTMAAEFVDYVIADPVVLPLDQQPFYRERIVHLPECYQVNDSRRRIAGHAPSRAEAGLPEAGFVFCCFNNNHKITRPVFETWMRLLHCVGGSVLWLLRDNAAAEVNLRSAAHALGIGPDRLVFAGRTKVDEHLARHRLADLFLDTLPYNAHTTASDALWAGLPVLTCPGRAFAGRVAASLLHAVGLPDLVAPDMAAYEALALRLARDPQQLGSIRRRLEENRQTCPLFDTGRFCRHIEAAYATMWKLAEDGEPPRSFSVS